MRSGVSRACTIALIAATSAGVAAQERPLPDQAAFLAEARQRLQTDSALQSSYTYVETRREQKVDRGGKVTSESVKVIESYPGLPGEQRWERLVSENGTPVAAAKLAAQDRERQRKAQEYARALAMQPAKTHARQRRDWEESQREATALIDDLFLVYDIRMAGREAIDGHDTIAFTLTPRRNAKTRTREGGIMRRFTARAWVSETDHELVRLETEAVEKRLARLRAARAPAQRRAPDLRAAQGERGSVAAAGGTLAGQRARRPIAMLRRGGTSTFSDYRKFTVDTSTTIATPDGSAP